MGQKTLPWLPFGTLQGQDCPLGRWTDTEGSSQCALCTAGRIGLQAPIFLMVFDMNPMTYVKLRSWAKKVCYINKYINVYNIYHHILNKQIEQHLKQDPWFFSTVSIFFHHLSKPQKSLPGRAIFPRFGLQQLPCWTQQRARHLNFVCFFHLNIRWSYISFFFCFCEMKCPPFHHFFVNIFWGQNPGVFWVSKAWRLHVLRLCGRCLGLRRLRMSSLPHRALEQYP